MRLCPTYWILPLNSGLRIEAGRRNGHALERMRMRCRGVDGAPVGVISRNCVTVNNYNVDCSLFITAGVGWPVTLLCRDVLRIARGTAAAPGRQGCCKIIRQGHYGLCLEELLKRSHVYQSHVPAKGCPEPWVATPTHHDASAPIVLAKPPRKAFTMNSDIVDDT